MADKEYADILSKISGSLSQSSFDISDLKDVNKIQNQYLSDISESLKEILKNGGSMSASNATNSMPGRPGSHFRNSRSGGHFGNQFGGSKKSLDFVDSFEKAFLDGMLGSNFSREIKDMFGGFADKLGVDLKDVQGEVGKLLGQKAISALKGTKLGSQLMGSVDGLKQKGMSWLQDSLNKGADYLQTPSGQSTRGGSQNNTEVRQEIKNNKMLNDLKTKGMQKGMQLSQTLAKKGGILGKAGTLGSKFFAKGAAGASASAAGGAAAGAGKTAAIMKTGALGGPKGLLIAGAIAVGMAALNNALSVLKDTIGAVVTYFKAMGRAANRETEQRKKNLEYAKQRNMDDMKVMIEKPFEILKEAVDRVVSHWDNDLRMISATQGYNKADLQSLMGTFASRLREEGLSDILAGSDITQNMTKVLESGLSGKVAEEFAYLATKLSAAVPTQDFFNYAATYASLAANAIRLGKSEGDAIAYANQQMELFASNVLFASRQIAGGFTTGLQNASQLFSQSVQIAQASRAGDPAKIGGVLTSVAAITGAIAPDLSQSMIDAVMKAATGGNSSELIALRSLAGINASNTEFLKQLSQNPQRVFSDLFQGLAKMQNMSENAWMENAEAISNIFGLSMDSIARVDFNYLAQAINKMNVNESALEENMRHLRSGETTTTAEQMKIAEINKKLIDEGLSYVMDNQAARAIQENMWAEQRHRETLEATFGIELRGAGLDALESLVSIVQKILDFLNPFSWLKKLGNLISSYRQADSMDADIRQMLELGKVGQGNAQALMQLTTRNKDLNLVDPLVNMMGGSSRYAQVTSQRKVWQSAMNAIAYGGRLGLTALAGGKLFSNLLGMGSGPGTVSGPASSQYNWSSLGKSAAGGLSGALGGGPAIGVSGLASTPSGTSLAQASASGNIQRMIDDLEGKIAKDKSLTYETWIKSARSYGIADFRAASEEAGFTEGQLKDFFLARQTEDGLQEKNRRDEREEEHWERLVFDSDSLWHLTEYANMVRDEFYEDFQEYHHKTFKEYADDFHKYHTVSFGDADNIGYRRQFQEYSHSLFGINSSIGYRGQFERFANDFNRYHTQTFAIRYHNMVDEHFKHVIRNQLAFHKDWTNFYIRQNWEKEWGSTRAAEVITAGRKGDREAIYDLADVLTQNNIDLRNPTMQTNALLAEIVKLLSTIMVQQANKVDGLSLFDTLSGMSLGLTQATTSP
jgi:hypothetical protein